MTNLPFPPLAKMLTSLPFLSTCVASFGHFWGMYTIQIGTPSYLNHIQHFSLSSVSSDMLRSVYRRPNSLFRMGSFLHFHTR